MTEQLNPLMLDTTTLSSGVGKLDTEITVEQIKDIGGVVITDMSVFGEAGVMVIDALTSKAEIIKFKGLDVLADGRIKLKLVERGMKPQGDLVSDPSTYAKAHTVGAEVILSSTPQIYAGYMKLTGDQNISGDLTLDGDVIYNGATSNPHNIVTRENLDTVVSANTGTSLSSLASVAGEDLLAKTVIKYKDADGKWYRADKDDSDINELTVFGYTDVGVTSGDTIPEVVLKGKTNLTGVSFNGKAFLGDNGGIANSGTFVIGRVEEDDVFRIQSYTVDQNLLNAQKGTVGHPDDTNRYVTKEGLRIERMLLPTVTHSDTVQNHDVIDFSTNEHAYIYNAGDNVRSHIKDTVLNGNGGYIVKQYILYGSGTINIDVRQRTENTSSEWVEIYVNDIMVQKLHNSSSNTWEVKSAQVDIPNMLSNKITVASVLGSNSGESFYIDYIDMKYTINSASTNIPANLVS